MKTDTVTVLPTEATTYTVLVTDASTCTATATVDVNVEGSPSITDPTANDYIWTGGASINWDNRYNWVTYDSENSKWINDASSIIKPGAKLTVKGGIVIIFR